VTASIALAELKGLAHTLPDPGILLNAIILKEAAASSEIENVAPPRINYIRHYQPKEPGQIQPQKKCCAIARQCHMASASSKRRDSYIRIQ